MRMVNNVVAQQTLTCQSSLSVLCIPRRPPTCSCALIQLLRHLHRLLSAPPQAAGRLPLQCAGDERRRRGALGGLAGGRRHGVGRGGPQPLLQVIRLLLGGNVQLL